MKKEKKFQVLDIVFASFLAVGLVFFLQPANILIGSNGTYISIKFFFLIAALVAYLVYFYLIKLLIIKKFQLCVIAKFCYTVVKLIATKTKSKRAVYEDIIAEVIDDDIIAPVEDDDIIAPVEDDEDMVVPVEDDDIIVAVEDDDDIVIPVEEEVVAKIDQEIVAVIDDVDDKQPSSIITTANKSKKKSASKKAGGEKSEKK